MESIVDPSYELLDPCPDVHALFVQFDGRFFGGRLAACEVKWSPRMTTCAGICRYEVRTGLCSIGLSTPLLKLRPRKDLVETLLHEMIHAYLFVTVRDRDRDGHGPRFQEHMHRINREAGTNITIYHSFHREVANYKTHHWRCEGACRDRRPFFGWVKRATNRAPSKNDLWWADHERNCGGKFIKVAEPKEFTEKQKKKAEGASKKMGGASTKECGALAKVGGASSSKSPLNNDPKQPKIDAVFGGSGTKLGGETTGVSRLVKTDDGRSSAQGGGWQMLGGGVSRSRLLDLFGNQKGGKSTVADANKENYRSAEASSDDEIQIIEVSRSEKRPRGGLKGGSAESLIETEIGAKLSDEDDEGMDDDRDDFFDETAEYDGLDDPTDDEYAPPDDMEEEEEEEEETKERKRRENTPVEEEHDDFFDRPGDDVQVNEEEDEAIVDYEEEFDGADEQLVVDEDPVADEEMEPNQFFEDAGYEGAYGEDYANRDMDTAFMDNAYGDGREEDKMSRRRRLPRPSRLWQNGSNDDSDTRDRGDIGDIPRLVKEMSPPRGTVHSTKGAPLSFDCVGDGRVTIRERTRVTSPVETLAESIAQLEAMIESVKLEIQRCCEKDEIDRAETLIAQFEELQQEKAYLEQAAAVDAKEEKVEENPQTTKEVEEEFTMKMNDLNEGKGIKNGEEYGKAKDRLRGEYRSKLRGSRREKEIEEGKGKKKEKEEGNETKKKSEKEKEEEAEEAANLRAIDQIYQEDFRELAIAATSRLEEAFVADHDNISKLKRDHAARRRKEWRERGGKIKNYKKKWMKQDKESKKKNEEKEEEDEEFWEGTDEEEEDEEQMEEEEREPRRPVIAEPRTPPGSPPPSPRSEKKAEEGQSAADAAHAAEAPSSEDEPYEGDWEFGPKLRAWSAIVQNRRNARLRKERKEREKKERKEKEEKEKGEEEGKKEEESAEVQENRKSPQEDGHGDYVVENTSDPEAEVKEEEEEGEEVKKEAAPIENEDERSDKEEGHDNETTSNGWKDTGSIEVKEEPTSPANDDHNADVKKKDKKTKEPTGKEGEETESIQVKKEPTSPSKNDHNVDEKKKRKKKQETTDKRRKAVEVKKEKEERSIEAKEEPISPSRGENDASVVEKPKEADDKRKKKRAVKKEKEEEMSTDGDQRGEAVTGAESDRKEGAVDDAMENEDSPESRPDGEEMKMKEEVEMKELPKDGRRRKKEKTPSVNDDGKMEGQTGEMKEFKKESDEPAKKKMKKKAKEEEPKAVNGIETQIDGVDATLAKCVEGEEEGLEGEKKIEKGEEEAEKKEKKGTKKKEKSPSIEREEGKEKEEEKDKKLAASRKGKKAPSVEREEEKEDDEEKEAENEIAVEKGKKPAGTRKGRVGTANRRDPTPPVQTKRLRMEKKEEEEDGEGKGEEEMKAESSTPNENEQVEGDENSHWGTGVKGPTTSYQPPLKHQRKAN